MLPKKSLKKIQKTVQKLIKKINKSLTSQKLELNTCFYQVSSLTQTHIAIKYCFELIKLEQKTRTFFQFNSIQLGEGATIKDFEKMLEKELIYFINSTK